MGERQHGAGFVDNDGLCPAGALIDRQDRHARDVADEEGTRPDCR